MRNAITLSQLKKILVEDTSLSSSQRKVTNWAVICDRTSGQSNYYTVRIVSAATKDKAIKNVGSASNGGYGSLSGIDAIRVTDDAPKFWQFSHSKGSFEDAMKEFLSKYEPYRI